VQDKEAVSGATDFLENEDQHYATDEAVGRGEERLGPWTGASCLRRQNQFMEKHGDDVMAKLFQEEYYMKRKLRHSFVCVLT
jgi:hypothetical protein